MLDIPWTGTPETLLGATPRNGGASPHHGASPRSLGGTTDRGFGAVREADDVVAVPEHTEQRQGNSNEQFAGW